MFLEALLKYTAHLDMFLEALLVERDMSMSCSSGPCNSTTSFFLSFIGPRFDCCCVPHGQENNTPAGSGNYCLLLFIVYYYYLVVFFIIVFLDEVLFLYLNYRIFVFVENSCIRIRSDWTTSTHKYIVSR